ncbi:conserved hypothetical protein [Frankia sp. Hr75.2]|nr:conserved hypothetical protein [Frankia sp. Hr75.2]
MTDEVDLEFPAGTTREQLLAAVAEQVPAGYVLTYAATIYGHELGTELTFEPVPPAGA